VKSRLALVLVSALACATLTSCEGFLSSSKMAQGQSYQSGDSRYDPYFESVHREQVEAAAWPDEKKNARKPLVTALSLTPDVSDETLVRKTRERSQKHGGRDPSLAAPYEETRRLEIERGRKLFAAIDKLEALAKRGEELKEQADKEYSNRGAEKADEKKTEKSREVRRELVGAADACASLAKNARKSVRDAEEFLEDLAQAYDAKDAPKRGEKRDRDKSPFASPAAPAPAAKPDDKPDEPKKHDEPKKPHDKRHEKGEPKAPPVAAAPLKPKPTEKSSEKPPAEKPAEKPKPPDEVFNP
jgi:hypothetical protein